MNKKRKLGEYVRIACAPMGAIISNESPGRVLPWQQHSGGALLLGLLLWRLQRGHGQGASSCSGAIWQLGCVSGLDLRKFLCLAYVSRLATHRRLLRGERLLLVRNDCVHVRHGQGVNSLAAMHNITPNPPAIVRDGLLAGQTLGPLLFRFLLPRRLLLALF